jgi:hypothetical protein
VFDKKASSYYGKDARESRSMSLQQIKLITGVLEKRLGIVIRPSDIYFRKEHYALIKNDLAIESNRRGEIIRISDEDGEWLLIDDSLEKGGELENVGKKAFQTNIPMQNWWNDNKKTNFQVTPSFLMEALNKVAQNQQVESEKWGFYAKNIESHTKAIIQLSKKMGQLVDIKKENVKLNKKQQTKLNKWF